MPPITPHELLFSAAEIRKIYGLPYRLCPDRLMVHIEALDITHNTLHYSVQRGYIANP